MNTKLTLGFFTVVVVIFSLSGQSSFAQIATENKVTIDPNIPASLLNRRTVEKLALS